MFVRCPCLWEAAFVRSAFSACLAEALSAAPRLVHVVHVRTRGTTLAFQLSTSPDGTDATLARDVDMAGVILHQL